MILLICHVVCLFAQHLTFIKQASLSDDKNFAPTTGLAGTAIPHREMP